MGQSVAVPVEPILAVALLAIVIASVFQIRSLFRAVGATSGRAELEKDDDSEILQCSYSVLQPGRVTASYPLGKLVISAASVDVRGPLGAYRFERSATRIDVAPSTLGFDAVIISSADVRIRIAVPSRSGLRLALSRYRWPQW
jgi:hypothetical protein